MHIAIVMEMDKFIRKRKHYMKSSVDKKFLMFAHYLNHFLVYQFHLCKISGSTCYVGLQYVIMTIESGRHSDKKGIPYHPKNPL